MTGCSNKHCKCKECKCKDCKCKENKCVNQTTSCLPCTPFNPVSGTYLYLATGFEDPGVGNALATVDIKTSKVIALTFIPGLQGHNTEPHHIGIVDNGTKVGFGGLLSVAYGLPDIFYFDITNQTNPTYNSSAFVPGYSATDEFYPYINGKYLITMMGGTGGGAPGAIAEFEADTTLINTWPKGLPDGYPYNPHGITYDPSVDLLLTSDFVLPISVVIGPPVFRNTVRMFQDFSVKHEITRTFKSEKAIGGFMSVLFIPGNPEKWAYACAEGQLYLIKPYEPDDAKAFTEVLNLPEDLAGYITINRSGTRLFAPTMNNFVYIDISDPEYPIILDAASIIKYYNGQFTSRDPIGAHYSKLSPDETYMYITDYFITSPVITDMGDKKLWRLRVTDQQIINDPCFEVDFANLEFNGTLYHARAHGIALVADPNGQVPLPVPQCKTFSKLCGLKCKQLCANFKQLFTAFELNAFWSIIFSYALINLTPDHKEIFNIYANTSNAFGFNFAEFYGEQVGAELAQQWFLYLAQGYIVMRYILEGRNTDKSYYIWSLRADNLAYFYSTHISCLNYDHLRDLFGKYQKTLFDLSIAFKQNRTQDALCLANTMSKIADKLADFIKNGIINEYNHLCGNNEHKFCIKNNHNILKQVILNELSLQSANNNDAPIIKTTSQTNLAKLRRSVKDADTMVTTLRNKFNLNKVNSNDAHH